MPSIYTTSPTPKFSIAVHLINSEPEQSIQEGWDLYMDAMLLGDQYAENNYFIILQHVKDRTHRNSAILKYLPVHLQKYAPRFIGLTNSKRIIDFIFFRLYCDYPALFADLFIHNEELKSLYLPLVLQSKIGPMVVCDFPELNK